MFTVCRVSPTPTPQNSHTHRNCYNYGPCLTLKSILHCFLKLFHCSDFNYHSGPGWGGCCNKSAYNYNKLLRNSKNWICHLFAHVISSPPCILGCVSEKLSIQKCFSTEFVTVLPYLKFSWKKYFVLLAVLVLSKTEYLRFALCMYFLFRKYDAI